MFELSDLRLFGIVVGAGIFVFAFLYFRGHRWSRGTFAMSTLVGAGLLIVGLFPDTLNLLRDVFDLSEVVYGRLLAILIFSNVLTLLLVLYGRAKHESLRHLVDRSLRGAAIEAVMPQGEIAARLKSIMVVIPALNEAENLEVLLPRIPKQVRGIDVGVLIVDDGSTDETREVGLRHGCLVARTPINRGQGAASRIGYGLLAREHATIGVTMDADNQHDPGEIDAMVAPILDGKLDLVIGSRMLGGADRDSRVRYAGVILFSRLVTLVTGVRITDCSSGYKAFKIDKIAKLDLREDQFQSSEVLIAAAKGGLRVGEVPIHIRRRGFGESRKGTNLTYGLFWLRTMAKSWWR